jgi:hypothetical protein
MSQVFFYVLFPNVAYGNLLSIAISQCCAKNSLTQEHALRMMAKCPVSKIRKERFRLVKPVVNGKIVFRFAAEFPGAAVSVFEWMGHGYTSYVVVV